MSISFEPKLPALLLALVSHNYQDTRNTLENPTTSPIEPESLIFRVRNWRKVLQLRYKHRPSKHVKP